jgi:hypothetical protein
VSEQGFPIYALAAGQRVRIGTAYKEGDGFSVSIGAVVIGGTPDAPATQRRASGGDGGAVFPPFGRSKGAPIRGASMNDLTFYKNAAERSLNDPSKSRWHEKERVLLDSIEAEIARQGGGGYEPPRNDGPVDDSDHIPF